MSDSEVLTQPLPDVESQPDEQVVPSKRPKRAHSDTESHETAEEDGIKLEGPPTEVSSAKEAIKRVLQEYPDVKTKIDTEMKIIANRLYKWGNDRITKEKLRGEKRNSVLGWVSERVRAARFNEVSYQVAVVHLLRELDVLKENIPPSHPNVSPPS